MSGRTSFNIQGKTILDGNDKDWGIKRLTLEQAHRELTRGGISIDKYQRNLDKKELKKLLKRL